MAKNTLWFAALLLPLLPALARAEYVLRPTSEADNGYTVTIDRPPSAPLGRSVAVPVGATVTVQASNHKPFSVVLIGPSGIMDTVQTRSWSARISQGGGYRLEFGPDNALYPSSSVLDFVAVDDVSQSPTGGDQLSEALYRQP